MQYQEVATHAVISLCICNTRKLLQHTNKNRSPISTQPKFVYSANLKNRAFISRL